MTQEADYLTSEHKKAYKLLRRFAMILGMSVVIVFLCTAFGVISKENYTNSIFIEMITGALFCLYLSTPKIKESPADIKKEIQDFKKTS